MPREDGPAGEGAKNPPYRQPPSIDRHTRIVRWLRVLLPVLALGLLMLVFLSPRDLLIGRIGLSGISFDPEHGLRLERPRISGEGPDGLPFVVTSDWALPDAAEPTEILLGPLTAEVLLRGGQVVRLAADAGAYRPSDRLLGLSGGVVVTTDDGYRMTAPEASADLADGSLRVAGPVEGRGPLGRIDAASMRAARRPSGNYMWFEGGVTVRINPEAAGGSAARSP